MLRTLFSSERKMKVDCTKFVEFEKCKKTKSRKFASSQVAQGNECEKFTVSGNYCDPGFWVPSFEMLLHGERGGFLPFSLRASGMQAKSGNQLSCLHFSKCFSHRSHTICRFAPLNNYAQRKATRRKSRSQQ